MDQEDQIVHQDVSESSTSHRNLAYPLIALLIVCGLVIGYFSQVYFGNNNRTLSQVIKKTEIAPTEKPDADPLKSLVGKQVLFDSLQNFDDMTNEDLPNFTDVRVVEPYEGLTLIMGFGRIALYSVAERKYVKMSDKTLSCATSAGLIGQRLYVGCNSETFAGPHRIFEIDMTTGKIARAYLSTSFIGKKYNAVNLKFATMGTILWGSSWDGVFKYDTVTKKLTLYSYDDLQFPEDDPTWNRGTTCRKAFLYKEKGLIKVLSQCDHTATYNEADDSWTTIHDPNNTLPPKINRTAKDFGLDLPSFSAFSDIRSGRRYLFNEEAVFTLEEDSFPVKVFDLVTKIRGGAPPHIGFVSSDERYALIFSDLVLGPHTDVADYTLGDIASFTLIDLTTGSSTDLIANSGLGPRPAEDYIRFGQYLEDSTFREEGRNISLYNENDRILSVNTLEKKIAFTIPSPTL